jgi:DNA invertase Pin-like site-specific DNA recombinase
MKPITERQGTEVIVPHKNGRSRKHESTVTTFQPTAEQAHLKPVGVTMRLSSAKTTEALNIDAFERQDITDDVEAMGGVYVHRIYCDPNQSASKKDVERPAFELQVSDLMAGVIQGIAVVDIDRVTRLELPLELLIDQYERHPDWFWWCDDSLCDLRTEAGRDYARDKVKKAKAEARNIGRRVTRRHKQARKAGVMVGSRGYGYTTTGGLMPAEAEVIHLLADAVDAGVNMSDFLEALALDGIKGKNDSTFTHRTVKSILTSPRIVGYRVDSSQPDLIARDANGEPIKGNQPAILDLAQWERIGKRFADRAVDTRPRKWLATEVLFCATCNSSMNGGWVSSLNRHRYVCANRDRKGCSYRANLHGPMTDEYIVELVELELAKDTPEVALPEPWPGLAELHALETRRTNKKAEKDAGTLDLMAWLDIDETLAKLIAKAIQAQRVWHQLHPMPTEKPRHELLETWKAAVEADDIPAMRRVIKAVIKRIQATPGSAWSASRLEVILQAQA